MVSIMSYCGVGRLGSRVRAELGLNVCCTYPLGHIIHQFLPPHATRDTELRRVLSRLSIASTLGLA